MTIPPEYLKERLSYDPKTGLLFWKHSDQHSVQWNGRWAGKEAFTSTGKNGYKIGRIDYIGYLAHRVIWAISHNYWPNIIDHIDGDRINNLLTNLRECTPTQNSMNAALPSHNSSGYIGVSWDKKAKKWNANIGIPNTRTKKSLGFFVSFDEAVSARKQAELFYGYHINHGRVCR